MSDKEEGSLPDSDTSPMRGSPRSRPRSQSPMRSRSRSASRSRSRSRTPKRRHKRSRSRSHGHRYSRSRSHSPHQKRRHRDSGGHSGHRRRRSHSRSPMSSRRRHQGDRDDPEPTRCLGIFGLSLHTQERDLREVFDRYGTVEEVQVVYDRQTGRSRGFSFLYFKSVNDAIEAKDRCTGMEIDGRRIRVDYSITERAHTPTPGIYLGKPTTGVERNYDRSHDRSHDSRRGQGGGRRGSSSGYKQHYSEERSYNRYRSPSPNYRRRSPSPYYGRRRSRSRSRSRSYSPHRFEERKMKCLKNET